MAVKEFADTVIVSKPCRSAPPHRALLRVAGADAGDFLQGQLSHDMSAVHSGRAQPSSINSPKGRVLATAICLALDDGFGLLLAPDIAPAVQRRLQMYVLRSRVTLALDDAATVYGVVGDSAAAAAAAGLPSPGAAWECTMRDGATLLRAPGTVPRWWVIGGGDIALPASDTAFAAADIACGLPCVGQAQSERHVAQHLGLDTLGALNFDKGCYTGQEVIARIHYRGEVNRVPVRLRGAGPAPEAGAVLTDADGKAAADVVNAVTLNGHCEALAVFRGREPANALYLDGRPFEHLAFAP